MATTGSMTAAVWLAPMIPKLPLPLAQRIERLLQAKPGRDTQEHALKLCEAIVAYAACIRASVAAAVVPAGKRSALAKGVGELRRVVEQGEATIASFRDLLVAAADAIEALEPGHPLGRAELTRPRTAWVARTQLVEALGDTVVVDEPTRAAAVDGGLLGIVNLWVRLVEERREVEIDPHGDPWLGSLGDVIVDTLGSSSLLGEASLTYPASSDDGELELLRLHGIEAEPDDAPAEASAYAPGIVCWRFNSQVVSSCGLLSYWVDEHDFGHLGVIARHRDRAEYLDYGSGARSPAAATARVAWDRLGIAEVKVEPPPLQERRSGSVFMLVAAAVAVLLVIVGVAWALWPSADERGGGSARNDDAPGVADPVAQTGERDDPPAEPKPETVSEIVLEGDKPAGSGQGSGSGDAPTIVGDETGGVEAAIEDEPTSVSVWFESERSLGICQVTYGGRTRSANLHLKIRQPEGPLEFSYRCGEHRGRGSIDVKPNRVNGVLFCKKNGSVKVKTVRSNEGRCDR